MCSSAILTDDSAVLLPEMKKWQYYELSDYKVRAVKEEMKRGERTASDS